MYSQQIIWILKERKKLIYCFQRLLVDLMYKSFFLTMISYQYSAVINTNRCFRYQICNKTLILTKKKFNIMLIRFVNLHIKSSQGNKSKKKQAKKNQSLWNLECTQNMTPPLSSSSPYIYYIIKQSTINHFTIFVEKYKR